MNRLLKLPEVLIVTGLKKSAVYSKLKDGTFPQSIQLGTRCVAWPSQDVAAWVDAAVAGFSDSELRTLVSRLHQQRAELRQAA
ncbi:MAG: AlpA family phage regulatory protein [Methylobacillus sp.]|jgi:prophage regulatory protein|nr:AlpA family phage regulatory protein [Methylobacillus sp.]